jgi:L-amino acid N-acyltransferase YncA
MSYRARSMTEADWPRIAEIYQQGIDTGEATFSSAPPGCWEEWTQSRMAACSLVAEDHLQVDGWACLSPVSSRCVYAGVAEVSLYVADGARGNGLGDLLMQALIASAEAEDIWTLQAGVFPENAASIRLHLKHGFRVVGTREKMGKMTFGSRAGQWRDVLLLERRSKIAGIN